MLPRQASAIPLLIRMLISNPILHCVLSYPTDPKDANLRIIETLKKDFPNVKVGFSDHVAPDDTMMTLAVAYMLGAEVIEKHFTLDKTLPGKIGENANIFQRRVCLSDAL